MWDFCGDRSESGDKPDARRTNPLFQLIAAGQCLKNVQLINEWRGNIAPVAEQTREIGLRPDGDSLLSVPALDVLAAPVHRPGALLD